MSDPTLVILAGGIGSRYGGLKQADPIGPNGELIIHYSVFDALNAGFGHVVFLIRRDIEDAFRERIGNEVERHTDVTYVFQDLDNVPAGYAIPDGRSKPWGTGHAVLCCKDAVHGNFAAINADDFYGRTAFAALADYLRAAADTPAGYAYSMVGYVLRNTLSEHGHVARGVCQVDADGYLTGIRERLHIEPLPEGIMDRMEDGSLVPFAADSTVSMNMWGFTTSLFGSSMRASRTSWRKASRRTRSRRSSCSPISWVIWFRKRRPGSRCCRQTKNGSASPTRPTGRASRPRSAS